MALAAMAAGACWVGLAGYLRHARGVNETISSLLLTYIAIAIMNFFVEGVLRDPGSANKPSTLPIGDANMIGRIPGTDVHWGLAAGILLAIALYILMARTTFGFAARITGGNARAALAQGLPVGKLIVACSMIAGACAGLAGFFEVAAIHGRANASLAAGYGFTGILVPFLARHNPLAIIPVAIMFGGIAASGGLIQRRMDLPDATVLVLQGFIFVILLASRDAVRALQDLQRREERETAYERWCARHRADRHARRRHPRLHALHVRGAGRDASPRSPAASIWGWKARWCSAPWSPTPSSYCTGSPWLGVLGAGAGRHGSRRACTAACASCRASTTWRSASP